MLGKALAIAGGLIVLVGAIIGAYEFFAHASDLELVAMRLEQKIQQDVRYDIQNQIWTLEDRYNTHDCMRMPTDDKDKCRKLKQQLEFLEKKLESIQKKTGG